jgi:hypothetical protein
VSAETRGTGRSRQGNESRPALGPSVPCGAGETLAVSLAWGLVIAVAGYAVMRALQVLVGTELDPAKVAAGPHAGFFWRSLTMLYAGGLASFVAWTASRGHLRSAARGLPIAIATVGVIVALQALFFP